MAYLIKNVKPTEITSLIVSLVILVASILFLTHALRYDNTNAAQASEFNPGRIIDDEIFYNSRSMTASQIQAFLNSKVPNCDTNGSGKASEWGRPDLTRAQFAQLSGWHAPPYTCLKDFRQDTPQMEGASGLCSALPARTNRTSAQIIDDVAKVCGINPQVLIILLQKEQSLVTDIWPLNSQYGKATGFACPDTAPCDPKYNGFFYQVYHAARQFKDYQAHPTYYNYVAGRNNTIYYHPGPCKTRDSGGRCTAWHSISYCGNSTVYIQNQATAALYIYTPYQPDQAALNNLYGTGGTCSSYGNRNFWRMFTDWFGSTRLDLPYAIRYDTTTDSSGEQAKIGIGLHRRPTSDVTLSFAVSSPSNAEIIGNGKITITRDTWNKPEKNIIQVKGLYNKNLSGSFQYFLVPNASPVSNDSRYSRIEANFMEKIEILHLDIRSDRAVYRIYDTEKQQHTFTSNPTLKQSLISEGWRDEGIAFRYCPSGEQVITRLSNGSTHKLAIQNSSEIKNDLASGFSALDLAFTTSRYGSVPVYLRYNNSDPNNVRMLYTTSRTEALGEGSQWTDKGVAFYACPSNTEPVYRLYRPNGSHFYTSSAPERDKAIFSLGYRYENLGFYACRQGDIAVHRFYKPSTGVRFYTSSDIEKDKVINTLPDYIYEGVGFRLCGSGSTDVYRYYNKNNGRRLFTTSKTEGSNSVSLHGYTYEGIGFVAL